MNVCLTKIMIGKWNLKYLWKKIENRKKLVHWILTKFRSGFDHKLTLPSSAFLPLWQLRIINIFRQSCFKRINLHSWLHATDNNFSRIGTETADKSFAWSELWARNCRWNICKITNAHTAIRVIHTSNRRIEMFDAFLLKARLSVVNYVNDHETFLSLMLVYCITTMRYSRAVDWMCLWQRMKDEP